MNQHNFNQGISFTDIIQFFWDYRKKIGLACFVAAVASAIFSGPLFITPKYSSTYLFFPSTNNSISAALLPEPNQQHKDPLTAGEEEEAERSIQFLKSTTLTNRLVKNLDLMNHYGINKKGATPFFNLYRKLNSNIKFSRTRGLAVKIVVTDKDPVMAAKMANEIANLYDTIIWETQKDISIPALKIVEDAHKAKTKDVETIKNLIKAVGQKGVTNYDEQSRAISEAIFKAQSSGKSALVSRLLEQQKVLVNNGGEYLSLAVKLELEEEKLSDLLSKLDRIKIDVSEKLPPKFTISNATVAEKKSYPVRWLLVVISTFTAFVLSIFFILFMQQIKKLNIQK